MTLVQLIADTNVHSYLFHESLLGVEYEELIGSQSVGVTGHSIAELRAGAVMAQWGEQRLKEQLRFLEQFTHVADTREMAEVCGAIRGVRSRIGRPHGPRPAHSGWMFLSSRTTGTSKEFRV